MWKSVSPGSEDYSSAKSVNILQFHSLLNKANTVLFLVMFLFFVFSIKRNREFCPVFLNNKPPGEAPLSMTFSDLSKLSNLL